MSSSIDLYTIAMLQKCKEQACFNRLNLVLTTMVKLCTSVMCKVGHNHNLARKWVLRQQSEQGNYLQLLVSEILIFLPRPKVHDYR